MDALGRWASDGEAGEPILISAAPGAGKTRPALQIAAEFLRAKAIDRVVVVAPTTPLTRQWAGAAAGLGLNLAPDNPDLRPPADFDGVADYFASRGPVAGFSLLITITLPEQNFLHQFTRIEQSVWHRPGEAFRSGQL